MKFALLTTHIGSGGTLLSRILSENPRIISMGATGLAYDHPTALLSLARKITNHYHSQSICIDKLLFNHQFSCKELYKICKFTYLIREPKKSLPCILSRGYTEQGAADYYTSRLRRMCEMAVKTPDAVLLTYSDIISKRLVELSHYLELKTQLTGNYTPHPEDEGDLATGKILKYTEEPDFVPSKETTTKCQKAYDKYADFLRRHLMCS